MKKLKNKKAIVVIAFGGSVLAPKDLDIALLAKLRSLLLASIKSQKSKFVIVVGGGNPARKYQAIAKKLTPTAMQADLDRIGIASTKLNAELIRVIFGKNSHSKIIDSESLVKNTKSPLTVISGWNPGYSTDAVAVRTAKKLKIGAVIIAGKPAYVYNKDFTKFNNAKPFAYISWANYIKLIPKQWSPGLKTPVDPIAAKEARLHNIDAIVISENNMKNIASLLRGRAFRGTLISNRPRQGIAQK